MTTLNEWLDPNHWQHIGVGILMEISNMVFWSAAAVETGWHLLVG